MVGWCYASKTIILFACKRLRKSASSFRRISRYLYQWWRLGINAMVKPTLRTLAQTRSYWSQDQCAHFRINVTLTCKYLLACHAWMYATFFLNTRKSWSSWTIRYLHWRFTLRTNGFKHSRWMEKTRKRRIRLCEQQQKCLWILGTKSKGSGKPTHTLYYRYAWSTRRSYEWCKNDKGTESRVATCICWPTSFTTTIC